MFQFRRNYLPSPAPGSALHAASGLRSLWFPARAVLVLALKLTLSTLSSLLLRTPSPLLTNSPSLRLHSEVLASLLSLPKGLYNV